MPKVSKSKRFRRKNKWEIDGGEKGAETNNSTEPQSSSLQQNDQPSTASFRKIEGDEISETRESSSKSFSLEGEHLWRSKRLAQKERERARAAAYYEEPDPGYRFIHLDSVRRLFQEGYKCKNANITFEEDQAKRYGQSALFVLVCSKCKKKTYLQTAKNSGGMWQPNNTKEINRRLVYAACETGIGREGMATICDILNMPQPMSSEAWSDHVDAQKCMCTEP